MKENERNEIYDAIVGDGACLIKGKDFELLNCGRDYCDKVYNGFRKVVISGDAYGFFSVSERDKFPDDLDFKMSAPKIPLIDLTKVGKFNYMAITDFGMDDLEELLKEKGAIFPIFD